MWEDAADDDRLRRTDAGTDGLILLGSTLPDLLEVRIGAWETSAQDSDPYAGHWVRSASADIFRLDVVFNGLVNPPGTLGLGPVPFKPVQVRREPGVRVHRS